MSHTATIDIDVKDPQVVTRTAQRLGYECQDNQEVRLYDGTVAKGTTVKLPGWQYPVVIDTDAEWEETLSDGTTVKRKGRVYSDNYNGRWGDQKFMDEFTQVYGVEKATHEAGLAGYACSESIVLHPETGEEEIELTINMPGSDLGGDDGGLNIGGGGLTVE
jgi:hypothetical protein